MRLRAIAFAGGVLMTAFAGLVSALPRGAEINAPSDLLQVQMRCDANSCIDRRTGVYTQSTCDRYGCRPIGGPVGRVGGQGRGYGGGYDDPPGVVAGTMTTAVIVAALEAALAAMPAVASRRELAASGRALAIAADADRCGRLSASAGRKNGPQGQFQLRSVSTVSCNHSTTVCTGYAVSGRGRD